MGWQVTFDGTRRVVPDEEREQDPFASEWEGGKVVDLDDLPPEAFDAIAADDGSTWWTVYLSPGAVGSRLYKVICAAAEHAGVEKPEKPSNMRESRLLIDMIERTQAIEDRPFVDGFPPVPPETETGSSSGPSNDLGGDLPK